ncbi:MAG: PFL family protein, partial [Clostridia bacterium]|nr:PFL family protein [Clostridia bacterium]
IPAPNKGVGDSVNFGGLLGRAPIMPVHNQSSAKFINRGGLIPAPIHSNKN